MTQVPRRFLAVLASASLLQGCASGPAPSLDVSGPQGAPSASAGPDQFQIGQDAMPVRAKDRLSVKVLREPELSMDNVRVDEDGTIDMPYIGRVVAEGHTAREIAAEIQTRLGQSYLVDPRVSVNVVDYGSSLVTVEGAVSQPGVYQFQPDATLLGAIALARGPARTANLGQVAIFRTEKGERSVAVFHLKKVRSGAMIDPVLKPGDRVLVGFDGLAQAWQDFLISAPLIGIFTRF